MNKSKQLALQGEVYCGKHEGIYNMIYIKTAAYTAGTHMLTLKTPNNQVLGTYKVIKH